jgi:phosphate transport system permease protein
VFGLLTGTVLVALVAVSIAVPFGVLCALFITEYSTARTRRWLTAIVDLLAAVPSLLFGLWGFLYLTDKIEPVSRWLTDHLGWIPFFATGEDVKLNGSIFIAGIVVSLMVLPIVTSVVREVFAQTPPGEKEAALALGSTRWGMVRTVVLPYGRGGIIGGSMLGLGRALGETIAVAILLPGVPVVTFRILENGGATVSGFIANRAGADAFTTSGLMAAGLVLFLITLGTNLVASVIVARSRSGAGVDL